MVTVLEEVGKGDAAGAAVGTAVGTRRRGFIKAVLAGAASAPFAGIAGAADTARAPARKKVKMKVGCQHGGTTTEELEFKARHGVFHIDGGMPRIVPGKGWDLDDSLRMRDACQKYGIALDAYHLPLASDGIDKALFPNIMLGKSPERDREIAQLQQMIEVAGKTGVGCLNYNTTILPGLRTGIVTDPKRGNARYNVWDYAEARKRNEPLTRAGVVDADMMFERIAYLLDRLLPVAEHYKVRLANHMGDPPTHAGYRGITHWTSPDVFAGIQRFARLYDSPSHGFNLCVGTVAEGLKQPRTEILPIVRWMGERKQIFNVHLRNIQGGMDRFAEVYPDNGDMDFYEVLKVLRDIDYPYMVMPDHVPHHANPAATDQGFAFAYGYIKAMLQALDAA